jgi:hypothetical protein
MTIKPTLEPLECRLTPANVAPPVRPPWLVEARGILWRGALPTIDVPVTLDPAQVSAVQKHSAARAAFEPQVDADTAKAEAALKAPMDPAAYGARLRGVLQTQLEQLDDFTLRAKAGAARTYLTWYNGRSDGSTAAVQLRRYAAYLHWSAQDAALQKVTKDLKVAMRQTDVVAFQAAVSRALSRINARSAQLTQEAAQSTEVMISAWLAQDDALTNTFYLDAVALGAAAGIMQRRLVAIKSDIDSIAM